MVPFVFYEWKISMPLKNKRNQNACMQKRFVLQSWRCRPSSCEPGWWCCPRCKWFPPCSQQSSVYHLSSALQIQEVPQSWSDNTQHRLLKTKLNLHTGFSADRQWTTGSVSTGVMSVFTHAKPSNQQHLEKGHYLWKCTGDVECWMALLKFSEAETVTSNMMLQQG